jgi:leader peptidase (prepilin peptidase)/N-methyltransferase
MPAAWVAVVFIFSLLVGSFLNVVIHRVPVMLEREWRAQAEEILREKDEDVGLKPDLQRTHSAV